MANGRKSLRYRIAKALVGRKSLVPFLDPIDGVGWPGSDGGINGFRDKQSQIDAIKGWVYAANRAIVVPAAAVKLQVERRDKDGTWAVSTVPRDLELLELFDNPNLVHTGRQLRQLHFTYMNIVGESFILMIDRDGSPFIPTAGQIPAALQIIPAHTAQLILGATYSKSVVRVQQTDYPIQSIIRDFNPSPLDGISAQSIVQAASAAVSTDQRMNEWNAKLFEQGAKPSMIYTTENQLGDVAYSRLERQIRDQHAGIQGANGVMILESGTVTPWGMSQQDLDFLQSRAFSRDEIFAIFNVSPGMVGQVENVNRANLEAGFYVHAVNNIVPREEQFIEQVNNSLVKIFDPNLRLSYVSPVPEDEQQKLTAAETGINKWWTADEVRDMYGMKPLPNGEGEHIIIVAGKSGATTLENVVSGTPSTPDDNPQNPEDPDDDGDDHLTEAPSPKSLEGEQSRKKDMPEPTPVAPSEPELSDEEIAAQRAAKAKDKASRYESMGSRYHQKLLATVRQEFEAQRQEVLSNFSIVGISGYGTKAYNRPAKKNYLNSLINWQAAKKHMASAVGPIIYGIAVEAGRQATGDLNRDQSMFDATTAAMMAYWQDRSSKISDSINDETEKQLRASLGQGTDNGESDDELRARIGAVFGAALTYRAARIGRTELTNGQAFGDIEAWKQSGTVTQKEWICQFGPNSCAFCMSMNGTIVGLDDDFMSDGETTTIGSHSLTADYGAVDMPPVHPNCACILMAV